MFTQCFFAAALVATVASCAPGGTGAIAANSGVAPAQESLSPTTRSDANAKILVSAIAEFSPEGLGQMGIAGLDTEIKDLKPNVTVRVRERLKKASSELQERAARETDPFVAQDLAILLRAAEDVAREAELEDRYLVPYESVGRIVFRGVHALLDDGVPAGRRVAALVRLERYAGTAAGYTPLAQLAMDRVREKMSNSALLMPTRAEVEKDLADAGTYRTGLRQLFAKYAITGYEEPLASFEKQLAEFEVFVRERILPRARTDFRQPPELYAFRLHRMGVDIPPAALRRAAHEAFATTQREMQALAPAVAQEIGLAATDYREVIRALKRQSVSGDALRLLYESRIHDMEAIITREQLVTLPARPMRFRFATDAETADEPAPHVDTQGLFAKGVQLSFVLPSGVTPGRGENAQVYDDFNYAAASWTLTAHEGRPGHELQFSQMAERGLSLARTMFAFNSVNVEGWGLYAEAITRPFMAPAGRLISLQFLLIREARAFLDPELEEGAQTIETARRVLRDDAMLSEAMTQQEIERYTFDAPGQATSYFYGYSQLLELRRETEQNLGARFVPKAFHDFVLAQGLLPPPLLRKAVRERFATRASPKARAGL